jgi:hypothetical protein
VVLNFLGYLVLAVPGRDAGPRADVARMAGAGPGGRGGQPAREPRPGCRFCQGVGLTFPVLVDGDGSVFRRYRVQLYPTTFFIGRDGVIRDVVYGGPMAETLIASKVARLLEE